MGKLRRTGAVVAAIGAVFVLLGDWNEAGDGELRGRIRTVEKLIHTDTEVNCERQVIGLGGPAREVCEGLNSCKEGDVEDAGFLRYVQFSFCVLNGHKWHVVPVMMMWLTGLIYMMVWIAEDYLCPSLAGVADELRLSPELAGVTLLALGNGSPDISSTFASVASGTFSIAASELVSASMFITTVVVAGVALVSDAALDSGSFLRNVYFLLGAVLALVAIVIRGRITIWEACGFLLYYVIFLAIVLRYHSSDDDDAKAEMANVASSPVPSSPSSFAADEEAPAPSRSASQGPEIGVNLCLPEDDTESSSDVTTPVSGTVPEDLRARLRRRMTKVAAAVRIVAVWKPATAPQGGGEAAPLVNEAGLPVEWEVAAPSAADTRSYESIPESPISYRTEETALRTKGGSEEHELLAAHFGFRGSLEHLFRGTSRHVATVISRVRSWREMVQKLLLVPQTPLRHLLRFTVPPLVRSDDPWDRLARFTLILCPVTVPLFVLFATAMANAVVVFGVFPLWCVVALCGAVGSAIVAARTKHDIRPRESLLVYVVGFVACCVWMFLIAREIVSCIKAIGTLLEVPYSVLAMTVLTWGNSIGDFISNTSIAKQGQPKTAMAASFSSPMFNLVFSLGLALTVQCVRTFPEPFRIERMGAAFYSTAGFVCFGLVLSSVVVARNKFVVGRAYAKVLLGMYIVCGVVNIVLFSTARK